MSSQVKNRKLFCYPDSIKSLILTESNAVGVERYIQAMSESGVKAEATLANNVTEYETLIRDHSVDLIIVVENSSSTFSETNLKKIKKINNDMPVACYVPRIKAKSLRRLIDNGADDVVDNESITRLGFLVQKIIDLEALRKQLSFNEDQVKLYQACCGEGFWDWYIDEGVVHFSERWVTMLNYEYASFEHSFSQWLDLIHPNDLGKFLVVWSEYMEGSCESFAIEYRIRDGNDNYRWIEARGASVSNGNKIPMHLAGSHNDITVRKEAELELHHYKDNLEIMIAERTDELENLNKKLSYLSSIDGLTEIPNRRCFNEYIDNEFRRSLRDHEAISLLLIDIDYFKAMNDTYGHSVGDDCIKAVASALSNSVHRPGDQVARYGGEEFAIVLPHTDEGGAINVCDHVFKEIASLNNLPINPKTRKPVTVSIGLSSFRPDDESHMVHDVNSLITESDQALYKAKKNGRNQYYIW